MPILPPTPPLHIDTTIFPPLASVEAVPEAPIGTRRASGAASQTMSVEEMHVLGVPLTQEGQEYLAALTAAEGNGEDGMEIREQEGGAETAAAAAAAAAEGALGGRAQGQEEAEAPAAAGAQGAEVAGEGQREQEGKGDSSLHPLVQAANFLRRRFQERQGPVSFRELAEGATVCSIAKFSWMLHPLQRRGFIALEETEGGDYIIRPGPRYGHGFMVLEEVQHQQRQRQHHYQQGEEGGAMRRRNAYGTNCSYCRRSKVKCDGSRPQCEKRMALQQAVQGQAEAQKGKEETQAQPALEAEREQEIAAQGEEEQQQGRRNVEELLWMPQEDSLAFAQSLIGPPPPEQLRRLGKRRGPPKRKRVPNAGSQ